MFERQRETEGERSILQKLVHYPNNPQSENQTQQSETLSILCEWQKPESLSQHVLSPGCELIGSWAWIWRWDSNLRHSKMRCWHSKQMFNLLHNIHPSNKVFLTTIFKGIFPQLYLNCKYNMLRRFHFELHCVKEPLSSLLEKY